MNEQMKILDLPLKAQWYDMIEKGGKREEYREIKPFWSQRLYQRKNKFLGVAGKLTKEDAEYACEPDLRYILIHGFEDNELKPFTHVRFRYGYTKRTMLFEIVSITVGKGKPEWGAPTDKEVFIIKFK